MPFSTEKTIILDSTGSTNNYAMELIRKGDAKHGVSVFAIEQTAGKGRLKRLWTSEPGSNIILSVITKMQWAFAHNQFALSMISALSAADLVERNSRLKAFVKWPNDLYLNDRKAGGILIENVIRGTIWQWAVTGFGININQKVFGTEYNATSLAKETNQEFNVSGLAQELKDTFLNRIENWKSGNCVTLLDEYNKKLYKKGETVSLQAGNRIFNTRIKGVTAEGKLLTEDAFEREWGINDVRMKTL